MRQIVLDTETTGREPALGHRIIEIGAIVLENREITNQTFHTYLNPGRDSDPEALAIHGLTQNFLKDKPAFHQILDDFIAFVTQGDTKSEIIIHNAKFDTAFLNAEINLCNQRHSNPSTQPYKHIEDYCKITDSLKEARRLHPNQRNNLNALCKRYGVDHSKRQLHGALLDTELLAQVYLKMTAGQPSLFDIFKIETAPNAVQATDTVNTLDLPLYYADPNETVAHQNRLAAIQKETGICFWEEQ